MWTWLSRMATLTYPSGRSLATCPMAPAICALQVRDFQSVIGSEVRWQAEEKWGGKPDIIVACIGGGSNAIGIFHEFVDDEDVRLIGVEAGEGKVTVLAACTMV